MVRLHIAIAMIAHRHRVYLTDNISKHLPILHFDLLLWLLCVYVVMSICLICVLTESVWLMHFESCANKKKTSYVRCITAQIIMPFFIVRWWQSQCVRVCSLSEYDIEWYIDGVVIVSHLKPLSHISTILCFPHLHAHKHTHLQCIHFFYAIFKYQNLLLKTYNIVLLWCSKLKWWRSHKNWSRHCLQYRWYSLPSLKSQYFYSEITTRTNRLSICRWKSS